MSATTMQSRLHPRHAAGRGDGVNLQDRPDGPQTMAWAQVEANPKPLPEFEAIPAPRTLPSTWDASSS
jgi:hypothetical protein